MRTCCEKNADFSDKVSIGTGGCLTYVRHDVNKSRKEFKESYDKVSIGSCISSADHRAWVGTRFGPVEWQFQFHGHNASVRDYFGYRGLNRTDVSRTHQLDPSRVPLRLDEFNYQNIKR